MTEIALVLFMTNASDLRASFPFETLYLFHTWTAVFRSVRGVHYHLWCNIWFNIFITPPDLCKGHLRFPGLQTKSHCIYLIYSGFYSIKVTQLGLEPRTPSLKGMCSTCWATRSFFQKRLQRYCFFFKTTNAKGNK